MTLSCFAEYVIWKRIGVGLKKAQKVPFHQCCWLNSPASRPADRCLSHRKHLVLNQSKYWAGCESNLKIGTNVHTLMPKNKFNSPINQTCRIIYSEKTQSCIKSFYSQLQVLYYQTVLLSSLYSLSYLMFTF